MNGDPKRLDLEPRLIRVARKRHPSLRWVISTDAHSIENLANLRFGVVETMETRVFGRLSAWQNWIFIRPNAVGESGALKVFGTGNKAKFDWDRV